MRQRIPDNSVFGNRLVLVLILFSLALPAGAASVAGKVVFATGNPVAVNASGSQRALQRGDDVFADDTLKTGSSGRLQVSFVDGAYISVQPGSEYKIEEYKYSGQPDGSESAVYRLIKGGVRALTGLIGKDKPEAYKVHTAAATIGVRGTGHNTRLCQGDCADRDDGLYHNTWEGITYVRNDVAETNVPAGKGVYVRDQNSPIRFLSQPSSVTAVETASEREKEQREEEEQTTTIAAGNQRATDGTQDVLTEGETPLGESTVLLDNGFIGVLPRDDPEDNESIDVVTGTNTSIFVNDDDQIIGLLTLEEFDGNQARVTATIDPAAMRGGDHDPSVVEINDLLATADPALLDAFRQDTASAAESFVNLDGLGWGRWSGGNFLVVGELGETELIQLIDHQSLHFIFGPEPPEIPTTGGAIYDFIGGTRSTSASGDTIGAGVTEGFLFADFGAGAGGIEMTVRHNDSDYHVAGFLSVDPAENTIFDQDSVFATTSLTGSDCNPFCPTFIEGGFSGPNNDNNVPEYAGIEYDIQDSDIIMGVAGFGLAGGEDTQVESEWVFTGAVPVEVEGNFVPASFGGFDAYTFLDPDGNNIGSVFTDPQSEFRGFATVDIRGMLAGNDPDAVGEFAGILGQADPQALARFSAGPARVAESDFAADGSGWGRWTEGRILSVRSDGQLSMIELSGNQSFHFIGGPQSPPISTNAPFSATYDFAGGTSSTSVSGDSIGQGVTDGTIEVNFSDLFASLDMNVVHADNTYNVSGSLAVDVFAQTVTDNLAVTAEIVSGPGGGPCDGSPGCGTLIQGGFSGALNSNGHPEHLGIHYAIQEADMITGVAGFDVATP